MNWVRSQGATLQLHHAGHPHHIKFNFQSGLCDNLQNDVFLFSVSHFTLGCLVPSAEYTHMTHLLSF